MNASVSMSADAPPPPSTEEADPTTTTKSSDPTCSATSQRNIPIIDLPYEVDQKGALVSTTSSEVCPVCHWQRSEPWPLGRMHWQWRKDLHAQASRCWFCKIQLFVSLEAMTEYEGLGPEEGEELNWNPMISIPVLNPGMSSGHRVEYEFFVPSETPKSYIDDIFKYKRKTILWDSTLRNSMDQSITWAQGHINNCLSRHELCSVRHGDESITPTPTRLIDVNPGGMDQDVKLRESKDLDLEIEYAALSYCWGGHTPECITDRQTLKRNLDRILWDSLPKTFRDAIKFTRGLGLKYLWIDSICVIQKDQDDWQKESGKMFDVYKNSKVTLAALSGKDSTSGLRTSTIEQETRLVATFRLGQSTCPLYKRRKHYLATEEKCQPAEIPLLTRAWTFQERMISPRVVFFTPSEVIYECACEVRCECGSVMMGYNTDCNDDGRPKKEIFKAVHAVSKRDMDMSSSLIPKIWRLCVAEVYSELEITNLEDRLVALGAIAEQFQQVRPGAEYLAGLWTDTLPDDLLWEANTPYKFSGTFPPKRHFNLPTWSWASSRGRIFHWFIRGGESFVEVVKASCLYAKDNQFGVLESSTLILRGKMLSCTLKKDRTLYNQSSYMCDGYDILLDFDPRSCLNWPEELEVYQLLFRKESDGTPSCLMLLLEDFNACPRVFSRLGIVRPGTKTRHGLLDLPQAFEQRGTIEEIEIR